VIRGPTASRLFDHLAVRLALLLSVALLPLGILLVANTYESLRMDRTSAERALLSLTADVEAGRRALIESALTTARVLSQPTLERLDDPERCRELMANTVRRSGVFSFAGFTEVSGQMRCVSSGEELNFEGSPVLEHMLADPSALVRRSEAGASSGEPVLIATHPVFENRTLRGFMSVVIELESFVWLRWDDMEEPEVRPILFNRMGEILSSGGVEQPEELLPEGQMLASFVGDGSEQVFSGRTAAGPEAIFAVAELVPGQLYVLGVWDPRAAPAAALRADPWPLLLPLVMWLASIGVVYFALYYLVIRHLRQLGSQMRRFALGDRTLPETFPDNVSTELREVQVTFRKMAVLVTRDEGKLSAALAEKEESLRERTVLLKEVHHRVKNNLQLIASILNLQMRRLRDPRSQVVLRNVQDRVIGLATIHRNLYQSEHLSELRADVLIEELLRHLFAVGTESVRKIDVQTDLDPVTLLADQLVPLSLLLTEGVTNALKYVGKPDGEDRPWIRVELKAAGDTVTLAVRNSLGPEADAVPEDDESDPGGLGSELIAAFASQLGGTLTHGAIARDGANQWDLTLSFRAAGDEADNGQTDDGAWRRPPAK